MGESREFGTLYPVAKAVVLPVVGLLWRINVTGLHNVPESGPAILCPNHISFFDSVVLPAVLPRRVSYVGKAEYLDDWKTRYLFPALGMVPIDRAGGKASMAALDTAASILDRGELFGIYPEGTRSRSGKLHRGRTGAARLAIRTGAPIIPVGLRGTDRIQPTGASVPTPFRSCQVNIGAPIDTGHYDDSNNRLAFRQLTDEVMFAIRELSGQDYEDVYAGSRPDDGAETRDADPAEDGEAVAIVDVTADAEGPEGPARSESGVGGESGERILVNAAPGEVGVDARPSSADVLAKWWQ